VRERLRISLEDVDAFMSPRRTRVSIAWLQNMGLCSFILQKVDFTCLIELNKSNTAIGTQSIVPQLSKEHKEIPT
jgi:hypothetical protein